MWSRQTIFLRHRPNGLFVKWPNGSCGILCSVLEKMRRGISYTASSTDFLQPKKKGRVLYVRSKHGMNSYLIENEVKMIRQNCNTLLLLFVDIGENMLFDVVGSCSFFNNIFYWKFLSLNLTPTKREAYTSSSSKVGDGDFCWLKYLFNNKP